MPFRRVAHPASPARPAEGAGAPRPIAEVCAGGSPLPLTRVRVLVMGSGRTARERLTSTLIEGGARVVQSAHTDDAPGLLSAHKPDVVLISSDLGLEGREVARVLGEAVLSGAAAPSVVLVIEDPGVEDVIWAVRAGVADVVSPRLPADEIVARVATAAGRAASRRAEARRVRRLKRLCRRLNSARREVVGQIESLCDDLAGAYEKMSDQMTRVAISSEFNSLVRQELDVEGLLRTVLEYALARVGPTNAAVFLPSSTGEHTLGAYVNYDVPKDAAEVLLDHLTTVIPHRFESASGPRCIVGQRDLESALGEDAHWLEGRTLVVMPCRKDGETLAVAAFFRDAAVPFTPGQLESCDIIADLFGKQIGRVIQVHHRHLPAEEWGLPGDGPKV